MTVYFLALTVHVLTFSVLTFAGHSAAHRQLQQLQPQLQQQQHPVDNKRLFRMYTENEGVSFIYYFLLKCEFFIIAGTYTQLFELFKIGIYFKFDGFHYL